MADKKLSSVPAVSDMNYVYAETSTGETVKISKADLASVVAGLIIKNDIAVRSYGGSESTLRLIKFKGVSGAITFEVISKKTDSGSDSIKSECTLLFSNGSIIIKKATNNHGLSYHNDGSSISIYASSSNLANAYVAVSILSGMEYLDSVSAQTSVSLPSGVVGL